METIDSNLNNGSQVEISPEVSGFILEMARWGKILSIIGFIGVGIFFIALVFGVSALSMFSNTQGLDMPAGSSVGMGVGMMLVSLIYIIPLVYLYRGSVALKKSIDFQTQDDLISGFSNYKSLFKFIGILTVLFVGIYALVFIVAILAGGGMF